jgi:chemotaxis family two-component system response regulator Rcp1
VRSAVAYLRRQGEYSDRGRPDLMLLDLNLPDLDGRAVLQTVKTDPALCAIPVIVMSTSVDDRDVALAYLHHANAFVSKPPDFDGLIETFTALQAFWIDRARLPPHR